MWPIYDFQAQLSPHINEKSKTLLRMTRCHQFRINHEGIRTKQFKDSKGWSIWRGNLKNLLF